MFNVYKNQLSWQTGSRNLTGPKTLPTIWGTYMKLVTKYQIPVINSCLEKCDEKCAYMFNVYKNQLSRQTGSRISDGSKNATHNMVYIYDACDQISDFCHQQILRKMRRKISWTDGKTDRGKTVYPPTLRGAGVYIQTYIIDIPNFRELGYKYKHLLLTFQTNCTQYK